MKALLLIAGLGLVVSAPGQVAGVTDLRGTSISAEIECTQKEAPPGPIAEGYMLPHSPPSGEWMLPALQALLEKNEHISSELKQTLSIQLQQALVDLAVARERVNSIPRLEKEVADARVQMARLEERLAASEAKVAELEKNAIEDKEEQRQKKLEERIDELQKIIDDLTGDGEGKNQNFIEKLLLKLF